MPPADPPPVLVIDDDPSGREIAAHAARREGLAVVEAPSAQRGLAFACRTDLAAVVLDLGLPDRDGFGVLAELHHRHAAPTLVVSADARESSCIAALRLGADDYVIKPVSIAELGARIAAVVRRRAPRSPADRVAVGDCSVDLLAHEVRRGDVTVSLTPRELALLRHLVTHPRRAFTRAQLLASVWDEPWLDPDTVTEHVRTLRLRLGGEAGRCITTVRGVGYRFDPST